MSNNSLSQREEECESLNTFTKKIHEEIVDIVSTLGWTIESIKTDNNNSLICPYDSSHRMSGNTLDRHLELCQWRKEGYNEFSVPLPGSTLSLSSPSSIKLDTSFQNNILQEAKKNNPTMKIENYEYPTWLRLYLISKHEFLTLIIGRDERLIPQTSDRIFTDFTCDERKALYEYVVSHTMKTDIGHDITDSHKPKDEGKDDKKLSFLELLVQERNLKRRRAKHKGVHTNKKSHTEILREVINQQMEVYMDYLTEAQTVSCDRKTESVAEIRTSNRNQNNETPNFSPQFNEIPPKRRKLSLEDPQDYDESFNFQYDKKYDHFEKSSSYYSSLDKRDKYSRIATESRKARKSHKHKRSPERERDRDRRSKHSSSRKDHKRHNVRSYEMELSNSNKHTKQKRDYREN